MDITAEVFPTTGLAAVFLLMSAVFLLLKTLLMHDAENTDYSSCSIPEPFFVKFHHLPTVQKYVTKNDL